MAVPEGVHDPLFVHAPGAQFTGHLGKEQGPVRVVAESAVEHVPPFIAGATVRVCVCVPD